MLAQRATIKNSESNSLGFVTVTVSTEVGAICTQMMHTRVIGNFAFNANASVRIQVTRTTIGVAVRSDLLSEKQSNTSVFY